MRSFNNQFNQLIKNERTHLLSILIGKISDFELAEDVLQEVLMKAWRIWQKSQIPKNPKAWILKSAYNLAIDVLRRQKNFQAKEPKIIQLMASLQQLDAISDNEIIEDERLKLIFICCHPALDHQAQVALTLCTVCGLSTEQVARAFLIKVPTLAQRLVRAKRKIKRSAIPYASPTQSEIQARLDTVLAVIYFIFNQGYYASDNTALIEYKFCNEAVYLAKILNDLLPGQAELLGLMALMHFHLSRFNSRSSTELPFIQLDEQDRSQWDEKKISQANEYFAAATSLKCMGPYQIQAAISGVHCQARNFKQTDWPQILLLYQKLYQYQPTDTVRINHAVALAYNKLPTQAWNLLRQVNAAHLNNYLPYYLAKAHVLRCLGKSAQSAKYLSKAMGLTTNIREKSHFKSQMERLNF